ncbi:hypothetical protein [Frankia sp. AiPa1]|uniref:hypothetical protein n=1 Tax=Frankia sp. AiPa1 TaxID=573492 RepID=UPI00202BA3E9|nr:hypothetical protein [Frankia sp. AiPa1]MCL9762345.1 hypothetical protein [Frankia sp. AiPa1]
MNTVGRVGPYLTDDARRVVVVRGMSLPAGVTPSAQDLQTWIGYGYTGVRLAVPVAAGGRVPTVAGWPRPGPSTDAAAADPGLDQAARLTRMLTDRGLRVVLRLVPSTPGRRLSDATVRAGLAALAGRFRAEPGLLGYEVPAGTSGGQALSDIVAALDPYHLVWQEGPAPFDPSAAVAVNDQTGYLTGWKDAAPATLEALAATADSFGLSWFYDPPDGRGGTQGGTQGGVVGTAGPSVPAASPHLVRPYPEAVAGIPDLLRYNAAGGLTLGLRPIARSGTTSSGGALAAGTATAISVPAWSYPSGYRVTVTGGRVTSPAGSGLLCVVASPGAARVEIRVVPTSAGPHVQMPRNAGAAGCDTSGGAGAGTSAAGTSGVNGASADGNDYSGPLLWALPLAGAAGATALLAAVLRPWRRGTRRSRADGPMPYAPDTSAPVGGD